MQLPEGHLGTETSAEVPSVTVIVPTYNRAADLHVVVKPLLDDLATTEVIVAVDGCPDGSMELLADIAATEPRLRPLWVEHSGKQAACQAALTISTGEVVLLIDDDVVAEPGLVGRHAIRHVGHHGLVVLGYYPTVLPTKRRRGDAAVFLYAEEYNNHCAELEQSPELVLRQLHGCNISLRRNDCTRVGFLSPDFPDLYHEDQDFGLRCLRAGLTGIFDRSLRASHLHTRTIEGFLRDARSQGAGQVFVHRLHSDVVGTLDPRSFEKGLPLATRPMMRTAAVPVLGRLWVRGLVLLAGTAGRFHAFSLESTAIRLVRRIEQQRGAILARHDRLSLRGGPVTP